ncbi:HNH endonuclease [Helicobacter sp. NHP21005]|uniref:HNH endonuclease n=1 Tax=Helicobacter felistomachi TaxID=3040201 RepID=UPI002572A040|nr:HNH endonuclease [Helicobacter sp. NHP21005]BEG57733.1 HNH endonuclease [Helicobacter sp. NHP21005]
MPVNVDTKEVRAVLERFEDFKEHLHQETRAFLQELETFYEETKEELTQTKQALQEAREGLASARAWEVACEIALAIAIATEWGVWAATIALNIATDKREKWEQKVALLEEAVEIYTEQLRRIQTILIEEFCQQSRALLLAYGEAHHELKRRALKASEIIEQQYMIPPEIQKLYDHLQGLESQLDPLLKQAQIQAIHDEYRAFLQERKEGFIVSQDETFKTPFNDLNLPVFPAIFSTHLDLKNLDNEKPMLCFYALKALQKALSTSPALQEILSEEDKAQINKGITPKGYMWHFDPNPH